MDDSADFARHCGTEVCCSSTEKIQSASRISGLGLAVEYMLLTFHFPGD